MMVLGEQKSHTSTTATTHHQVSRRQLSVKEMLAYICHAAKAFKPKSVSEWDKGWSGINSKLPAAEY